MGLGGRSREERERERVEEENENALSLEKYYTIIKLATSFKLAISI